MHTVKLKAWGLQSYRLAVLVVIAWFIHDVALQQRIQSDAPLKVDETRTYFTNAVSLRLDDSEKTGAFVLGTNGVELGYVVRTQPVCKNIIGYSGVTDVLIAFDLDWKIIGLKVRSSEDTRAHVADILHHRKFMKTWNGMAWDAVAEMNLKEAGIEGVSGATMTSMAIANSVKERLRSVNAELAARPAFHLGWRDVGMLVVIAVAAFLAYGPERYRRRWRRVFQVVLIVYVGFISGDLVAQSLLSGWLRNGVPWTAAPGLLLVVVAAFALPWATRQPFYCHNVCPHGAAQELLGRWMPVRYRLRLPAGLHRGLRYLPPILLVLVMLASMVALPVDLASVEPFDAYLIRTAGWATITIAVVGLVASLFVPQAYCKFGCPTGALLEFARGRGPADRFSGRDALAAVLVVAAFLIHGHHHYIEFWLQGLGRFA